MDKEHLKAEAYDVTLVIPAPAYHKPRQGYMQALAILLCNGPDRPASKSTNPRLIREQQQPLCCHYCKCFAYIHICSQGTDF